MARQSGKDQSLGVTVVSEKWLGKVGSKTRVSVRLVSICAVFPQSYGMCSARVYLQGVSVDAAV